MKLWKKILLGAVALVIIGGAVVAVWQKDNIKAIYSFLTKDSDAISQELDDKRKQQQDALANDYHVTVQSPSKEQSDGLLDGALNPDDVKESLGLTQVPENSAQNTDKQETSKDATEKEPEKKPVQKEPQLSEEERKNVQVKF